MPRSSYFRHTLALLCFDPVSVYITESGGCTPRRDWSRTHALPDPDSRPGGDRARGMGPPHRNRARHHPSPHDSPAADPENNLALALTQGGATIDSGTSVAC